MANLSVLIVDDEIATRELLVDYIPWREIGYDTIYQAENGEKALKIIEAEHPNLLLSDIVMPKMNGVELLSHIHDNFPLCKAIFLSGYSDKEYLISAIRLGAVDYIEKPIDLPMLTDLIKTVTERIHCDAKKNDYFTKRGYLIHDLCEGNPSTVRDIPADILQAYRLESFQSYTVLLTQAATTSRLKEIMDCFKAQFTESEMSVIYTEWQPGKEPSRAIVGHNLTPTNWALRLRIFQSFFEKLPEPSFIAVGSTEPSISTLSNAFSCAKERFPYAFYATKNYILYHTPAFHQASPLAPEFLEQLRSTLKKRNATAAHNLIRDSFQQEVTSQHAMPLSCVQNNMLSVLRVFDEVARDKGMFVLEQATTEENVSYLWELATWFSNAQQFENYVNTLIPWLCTNQSIAPHERSTQKAITFIEDNLGDYRLGVEAIATYLKLTPSYACQIFKKSTGTTINHYITELRFCKAKHYLLNTTLTISEIVAKVGYTDTKYFSKTFKQFEGSTPSDYRRNHL